MNLSQTSQALVRAYRMGYRIRNNQLFNPDGKPLKGQTRKTGYAYFGLKNPYKRTNSTIFYHRLVAYEKYGDKIFEKGVLVRHLDGNPRNNFPENIAIGTQSDNMMDRDSLARHIHAKLASQHIRRFSDDEVKSILIDRKAGMRYVDLCQKYNTSKSTLSYLFNFALYAS